MKAGTKKIERRGFPSPMAFHLGATVVKMQQEMLASSDPLNALSQNTKKLQKILAALECWQQHPHFRQVSNPPVIWQKGSSKLFDFGQFGQKNTPKAPAILVIPSLVNKPYILDLSQQNSLMQNLKSEGLQPYLLDWGSPDQAERNFDLNSYIEHRALPALNMVQQISGGPVGILGYCMGGTIAVAISQLSSKINSLCTIGAPWNFANPTGNRLLLQQFGNMDNGQKLQELIQNLAQAYGNVPFEFMQYLFAAIDPDQFAKKFLHFGELDPMSEYSRQFVCIEDWLNDGAALSGPAADDLLVKWHLQNQIMTGNWTVCGTIIDATKITVPGMFVCGKTDTIAPSEATLALPDQVRNATLIQPDTGHIGMIVGSKSRSQVVLPVADFFRHHAN